MDVANGNGSISLRKDISECSRHDCLWGSCVMLKDAIIVEIASLLTDRD